MPETLLSSSVGSHLRRFSRDETTVSHAPIMITAVLVALLIFANLQSSGGPATDATEAGSKTPATSGPSTTGPTTAAVLQLDRSTGK